MVAWKFTDSHSFTAEGCSHDTALILKWAQSIGLFADVKETSAMAKRATPSGSFLRICLRFFFCIISKTFFLCFAFFERKLFFKIFYLKVYVFVGCFHNFFLTIRANILSCYLAGDIRVLCEARCKWEDQKVIVFWEV